MPTVYTAKFRGNNGLLIVVNPLNLKPNYYKVMLWTNACIYFDSTPKLEILKNITKKLFLDYFIFLVESRFLPIHYLNKLEYGDMPISSST